MNLKVIKFLNLIIALRVTVSSKFEIKKTAKCWDRLKMKQLCKIKILYTEKKILYILEINALIDINNMISIMGGGGRKIARVSILLDHI